MDTQNHHKTAAFLEELHTIMDDISEYWLHTVDFNLSQTGRAHGHYTMLKVSKNITDGAIRIEYKPRMLTETQLVSLVSREAQMQTNRQRTRLIEEFAKEERQEEIESLERRLQRIKERRARYGKR